MGLFDTFVGEFKCHYCDETVEFEEQTKNYDCCLRYFKVGDFIDKTDGNYFYKFNCECPKCKMNNNISLKIVNGTYAEIINYSEYSDLEAKIIEFSKTHSKAEIIEFFGEIASKLSDEN